MLREPAPRHLGERAGRAGRADDLLVAPLPHLDRAVLAPGQVQRHQRVRTHPLDVVDLVFEHLLRVGKSGVRLVELGSLKKRT